MRPWPAVPKFDFERQKLAGGTSDHLGPRLEWQGDLPSGAHFSFATRPGVDVVLTDPPSDAPLGRHMTARCCPPPG